MGDLAERLTEEMTCETVFTIPIFGGIEIDEAVVVTWIIIALLGVASFFLTRNLRVETGGKPGTPSAAAGKRDRLAAGLLSGKSGGRRQGISLI